MPGAGPQPQRESTISRTEAARKQTRHPELEVGTVLFFARPSLLQSWAEFFGHRWRHVGVVVERDEGVRIASYGPKVGFRLDDPADCFPNYTEVAAARVLYSDAERERLNRWIDEFVGLDVGSTPFVISAPLVGPLHLIARRNAGSLLARIIMMIVIGYCSMQTRRHRDRMAFVCSTFTWTALRMARDKPLRVPLTAHPDDEVAYAEPECPSDVLLARWLCGPTELWHAISEANRWNVDLSQWHDLAANNVAQRV